RAGARGRGGSPARAGRRGRGRPPGRGPGARGARRRGPTAGPRGAGRARRPRLSSDLQSSARGRVALRGPPRALPETPHLRHVAAVLHRAPLAAAVSAAVEEEPAAALARTLAGTRPPAPTQEGRGGRGGP